MIHPTAIIDPSAKLGANVSVGAYSIIGPDVELDDNCQVASHVVINGPSVIGKNNRFFQFASIGEECQDKKYAGEATRLEIGDNNVFRECVTVHRGTIQDSSLTKIGSNNLLMAYVHVAHDCMIGDNNILANNASIAGHVKLGDWVILGGMTGVHQFCHIGSHCFTGVGSVVVKDIPPFVMAAGQNAVPHGINTEGLKRRGYSKQQISLIRQAYKTLYRSGLTVKEALADLKCQDDPEQTLAGLLDFVESSTRGIIR